MYSLRYDHPSRRKGDVTNPPARHPRPISVLFAGNCAEVLTTAQKKLTSSHSFPAPARFSDSLSLSFCLSFSLSHSLSRSLSLSFSRSLLPSFSHSHSLVHSSPS